MAVGCFADQIFFGDHALEFDAETFRLQHIAHADSAPSHFVFVGRADPARSGPDLRLTTREFRGLVHFAMVGKDQVRAVA